MVYYTYKKEERGNKVKVCYKSFDGREFNTEEECLKYEENPDIKMYGPDGRTDDILSCYAVRIDKAEAAKNFIKASVEAGVISDGIKNIKGTYIWSADDERCFTLDSLAYKALGKHVTETGTQE